MRSEDGAEDFLKKKYEAAGGVKQSLQKFIAQHPDVRLIDERFMEIRQAMGCAKGKLAGRRVSALLHRGDEGERLRGRTS